MSTPTTKYFPTLAVVGVWSGRLLEPDGFPDFHAVMGHLFPGVVIHHMASRELMGKASDHLRASVPGLDGLPKITGDNWREVAALSLETFGPTLPVVGPIGAAPHAET